MTPKPVIKAYARRIKRGELQLSEIENETTRKDVEAYLDEQENEDGSDRV